MKFTRLEKERLKNAVCFEPMYYMLKNLCVIVIHNESQEVIHVVKFKNFRRWIKKDPSYYNDLKTYTYKLKLIL